VRELEPLTSEFIPINYANAADIQSIINSEGATLLTGRGSITVDPRTNTLLVRETASQIAEIRGLIAELDVPVRQVLIESRIVSATDDFSKSLGVRFGYENQGLVNSQAGDVQWTQGNKSYALGGSLAGTTTGAGNPTGTLGDNLLVDLPSTLAGGSVGLALGTIGSYLLQLELSAMQSEGRGEVISNPRLVTADKTQATIESGVQIPYQEASSSGATSTSFQNAVLSLGVTPQITPDNRVIMDLAVNKDAVSTTTVNGVPAINTQNITTQVVVDNGETVVLGGVYERTSSEAVSRVPFFSDLPYVGWAFRNKLTSDNKSELLIFVTPKILKDESQLN
jgi:type IV pilus assembly protein PilQ